MNHSARFWELLDEAWPTRREQQAWLRRHGAELHSDGPAHRRVGGRSQGAGLVSDELPPSVTVSVTVDVSVTVSVTVVGSGTKIVPVWRNADCATICGGPTGNRPASCRRP